MQESGQRLTMKTQTFPPFFGIEKTIFCLAFVLSFSAGVFSSLPSSQNYSVEVLDDTRTALLPYYSGVGEPISDIGTISLLFFALASFSVCAFFWNWTITVNSIFTSILLNYCTGCSVSDTTEKKKRKNDTRLWMWKRSS